MRVLVVEGEAGCGTSTVDELGAAGHEVVRCHEPGQPAFPCAALIDDARCPITDGAIDVAVAVRDAPHGTELTSGENGVSCALRHFIPLVAVGHDASSPLVSFATEVVGADEPAADAILRAQAAPLRRHERLARDAFRHVLDVHGLADVTADARVTRHEDILRVELRPGAPVPKDIADIAAVRAVASIRQLDQQSRVINVVVEPSTAASFN